MTKTRYLDDDLPAEIRDTAWWKTLVDEDVRIAREEDALNKARAKWTRWADRETAKHAAEAEAAMRRGDPAPAGPDIAEQTAFYAQWANAVTNTRLELLRRERAAIREHRAEVASALAAAWEREVTALARPVAQRVDGELAPALQAAQRIGARLRRLGYGGPVVQTTADVLALVRSQPVTVGALEEDRQREEAAAEAAARGPRTALDLRRSHGHDENEPVPPERGVFGRTPDRLRRSPLAGRR